MRETSKEVEVPLRVRELRQRLALSQKELGEKAGLSEKTIQLIEAGAVSPHPKTIRKLAEALGVQPWELQGEREAAA